LSAELELPRSTRVSKSTDRQLITSPGCTSSCSPPAP